MTRSAVPVPSRFVPRPDLLTVAVEDYYQVTAFNRIIRREHWYRFEARLEQNTSRVLDLLDRFRVAATFFFPGWVADTLPEIVREVARRGHEVASKGYYQKSLGEMTRAEFREELSRSREALERETGEVFGFRLASGWLAPADLWVLDALAEEGYHYDSSLNPSFRSFAALPWRRSAHVHTLNEKRLWEFPISTWNVLGWRLPIGSGPTLRQLPGAMARRAVERWHRHANAPFVMSFSLWELDPEQPVISAASLPARVRHYRRLGQMARILESYLSTYRFGAIADYLALREPPPLAGPAPAASAAKATVGGRPHASPPLAGPAPAARAATPMVGAGPRACPPLAGRVPVAGAAAAPTAPAAAPSGAPAPARGAAPTAPAVSAPRTPVSVVVPCYNEASILPYLANTLRSVEAALGRSYDLRFMFVDDASDDGTWDALQTTFGAKPNCTLLRHEENRGVAAAILTGIRHAETEVVCSMDCDCTYDPHELGRMIPMLGPGVDLVTASPYHPEGAVRNVPAWRLVLSRALSLLYRQVLRQRLSTYSSCFRVYRRSAVADLETTESGFLGVAEMLGRLDLRGSKILEYPTTLDVRVLGRSKMNVARTITGHLRLLGRLLLMRWTQAPRSP